MHFRASVAMLLLTAPSFVSLADGRELPLLRTQPDQGATGVFVSEERSGGTESMERAPLLLGGSGDGTVLWHRHHNDAIYTSAGAAEPAGLGFAGNYWISPVQVEAVPLEGDGTPDWIYGGTRFFVDASRNAGVLAAVDFEDSDSTATIMQWDPGSSTPLWTYVVHPCRSLTYQGWASRKPIRVSDDGSTIAVGITMYGESAQQGRLYVFDAGDPVPAVVYDLPTGSITAVEVTPLGEYVALAAWPTVYVYDRFGETLRWSGAIGAGNDALAISPDGQYLAWGWTTFNLREWNGSSYGAMWTYDRPGTYYVAQCAFSADNALLGLSWDNGNLEPNEVYVDLYELPSLDLLWEYDYGSTPVVGHVDGPSQMTFAESGDHFAISSWGGAFPEVQVFEAASSTPIFTLDTPGSMFDVELVTTSAGNLHLTTCGKDVHAGTGGRGGDFYSVEIQGSSTGVPGEAESMANHGRVVGFPSPFGETTRIEYSLTEPGPVRIAIYDPLGRLVRTLADRDVAAGQRTVIWDGRSDAGLRVSAGVYLARVESEAATQTGRILRVR